MMQLDEVVALSIFVLYFVVIISLFVLILWSIFAQDGGEEIKLRYGMMAVVSFAHTWYWMFKYMSWSLHNFEASSGLDEMVGVRRIARWLVNTSLFEEAWWAVCKGAVNWWWSEQLCLFTAGFFTIFLVKEQNIRYKWAYMLLGQMVAISVAWSLALLAASAKSRSPSRTSLSASVTVPVTLSYLTILVAPYATDLFLVNLTAMHGLLFVPFLLGETVIDWIRPAKVTSFCKLLAVAGMAMRVRTWYHASDPRLILNVMHSHPAQASIGWDIVYTSVIWLLLLASEGHVITISKLLGLVLVSVGVSGHMYTI